MRTIVDIPDDQIAALARICSRAAISRTEAIRQAIALYAVQHTGIPSFADACGRWQDRKLDGRAYQTPCDRNGMRRAGRFRHQHRHRLPDGRDGGTRNAGTV